MKKLFIVLTLIIILTGCKSIPVKFNIENNNHQAIIFNLAMLFLESKGYSIGNNVEQPFVIIHSSPKMLQDTLNLSKPYEGWYDPDTKTVHLTVGCSSEVIKEEFIHFLLDSIGIPLQLHHGIMGY